MNRSAINDRKRPSALGVNQRKIGPAQQDRVNFGSTNKPVTDRVKICPLIIGNFTRGCHGDIGLVQLV